MPTHLGRSACQRSRDVPWHPVALHGDCCRMLRTAAYAASDVCINGVNNVACAAIE